MVTVSFLISFFWSSNVIEMNSLLCRLGAECSIGDLFLKNRKLRNRSLLVLRDGPVTVRYSQLRSAKKKAPPHRSAMAFDLSVVVDRNRCIRRQLGKAFWCFAAGSWFL